jgi:hypothetical protein
VMVLAQLVGLSTIGSPRALAYARRWRWRLGLHACPPAENSVAP